MENNIDTNIASKTKKNKRSKAKSFFKKIGRKTKSTVKMTARVIERSAYAGGIAALGAGALFFGGSKLIAASKSNEESAA